MSNLHNQRFKEDIDETLEEYTNFGDRSDLREDCVNYIFNACGDLESTTSTDIIIKLAFEFLQSKACYSISEADLHNMWLDEQEANDNLQHYSDIHGV
jgi:hypothetical protein